MVIAIYQKKYNVTLENHNIPSYISIFPYPRKNCSHKTAVKMGYKKIHVAYFVHVRKMIFSMDWKAHTVDAQCTHIKLNLLDKSRYIV